MQGYPSPGTMYMWDVIRVAWSSRIVMGRSQADIGAHTAAGLLAGQACGLRLFLFLTLDGVVQAIPGLRQLTKKVNTIFE